MPRRIICWRDKPPIKEVKPHGVIEGVCLDGMEAYDHATAGIMMAQTGTDLPVKRGPLRQTDLLLTPLEERGSFAVWLVHGALH